MESLGGAPQGCTFEKAKEAERPRMLTFESVDAGDAGAASEALVTAGEWKQVQQVMGRSASKESRQSLLSGERRRSLSTVSAPKTEVETIGCQTMVGFDIR